MPGRILRPPHQIRDTLDSLAGFGADEVMLYCWSHDVDQVERIADAVDLTRPAAQW